MSHFKRAAAVAVPAILLFTFCSVDPSADDPLPEIPVETREGFRIEQFAGGLELPTSVEFPPDGSERLFVNELQSGRIWIIQDGVMLDEPFAELNLDIGGGFPADGENGLIGLEFDIDYENNGYVYVTYTQRNGTEMEGVVARFRDAGNRGEDFTILLSGLPADIAHQVQNLRMGPDEMLYVSVGDAYEDSLAQDPDRFNGKILRMDRDGRIPADNPAADSYVYASGFRNAFDLVFRENGDLLAADNGVGTDRLVVVEAGLNYGWPESFGFSGEPEYQDPVHLWEEGVAPAGMHIYLGTQFPPEYRGRLFQVLFGPTWSSVPHPASKRIQVTDLEENGQETSVRFEDFAVWQFDGFPNNPLDITAGPDGSLYITDLFQGSIFRIYWQP